VTLVLVVKKAILPLVPLANGVLVLGKKKAEKDAVLRPRCGLVHRSIAVPLVVFLLLHKKIMWTISPLILLKRMIQTTATNLIISYQVVLR
jgi:hypothetical protein